MHHLKTIAAIAAAALALTAVSTEPASAGKVKPAPVVPTYSTTLVAVSPGASRQATAWGQRIKDLGVYNGKIYPAYGNYDDNTGPIDIEALDPATGTFGPKALTVPTEELNVFRTINGKMYAPMIDPQLPWTANVGYATNASGTWTNEFKAPAQHIFDVATMTGTDLWMLGSASNPDGSEMGAAAYRSTDGGATWKLVANDASPGGSNGYERYYWAKAINGKMYMQAQAVNPGPAPLRIFDGNTWTSTTAFNSLCGGANANLVETFNNKIICAGYGIKTFDGRTATQYSASSFLQDLFVAGDGYIYALTYDHIVRSSDGTNWTPIANAPADALSIAVVGGTVYLGMTNARIVKLNGLNLAGTTTKVKAGNGKQANRTTLLGTGQGAAKSR